MQEITLLCPIENAHDLRSQLERELSPEGLQFEEKRKRSRTRAWSDPSVLVAVVGGTSAAVSALIAGLFRVIESQSGDKPKVDAKIIMKGSNGRSLEVPAGTSLEDVQRLVELTASLDGTPTRIVVISSSFET
jgi:hypothetical protein